MIDTIIPYLLFFGVPVLILVLAAIGRRPGWERLAIGASLLLAVAVGLFSNREPAPPWLVALAVTATVTSVYCLISGGTVERQ